MPQHHTAALMLDRSCIREGKLGKENKKTWERKQGEKHKAGHCKEKAPRCLGVIQKQAVVKPKLPCGSANIQREEAWEEWMEGSSPEVIGNTTAQDR